MGQGKQRKKLFQSASGNPRGRVERAAHYFAGVRVPRCQHSILALHCVKLQREDWGIANVWPTPRQFRRRQPCPCSVAGAQTCNSLIATAAGRDRFPEIGHNKPREYKSDSSNERALSISFSYKKRGNGSVFKSITAVFNPCTR